VTEPRDDTPEPKEQGGAIERKRGGGGPPQQSSASREPGFFHIYKKGQGYWTRMGTVIGAGVMIALIINFLYTNMPTWVRPAFDNSAQLSDVAAKNAAVAHASAVARNITIASCAAFLAATALLVFWLMNKPSNADFLIATDSEMKKVNWTSRRELIGSSKVVIIFMLLMAVYLFANDVIFGYLMYLIKVLKVPPPPFS
jgi:preprotein translocase SecE subunit